MAIREDPRGFSNWGPTTVGDASILGVAAPILGRPKPAVGGTVRRSRFADVSPARWPKMRQDGSLSVAIRIRCSDSIRVHDVEAVVSAALSGPESTDPLIELQTLHRVVRDEPGRSKLCWTPCLGPDTGRTGL